MKKILFGGAGGAPTEGVINSLLFDKEEEELIGMGSEPTDLVLSNAKRKYVIPYAYEENYEAKLLSLLEIEKPNLVHFQNDIEVLEGSKRRKVIFSAGSDVFMPEHEVIDTCVDKYKSYLKWESSGIEVAKNILLNEESDLEKAFKEIGDQNGMIWLRASSIGGGGKGALPTNDYTFAKKWIEKHNGWGDFLAAEMLTSNTVTWLSVWHEGKLIVAQTRIRKGWTHGNRTLSGVTGVTKVGQTYSNPLVDEVALAAIKAIDGNPHGIYGVDMAYDQKGIPKPTEINISRFFTTVLFFTHAGLNMPKIFKDIALYKKFPKGIKKLNPLPNGLMWLRGMDTVPVLLHEDDINSKLKFL